MAPLRRSALHAPHWAAQQVAPSADSGASDATGSVAPKSSRSPPSCPRRTSTSPRSDSAVRWCVACRALRERTSALASAQVVSRVWITEPGRRRALASVGPGVPESSFETLVTIRNVGVPFRTAQIVGFWRAESWGFVAAGEDGNAREAFGCDARPARMGRFSPERATLRTSRAGARRRLARATRPASGPPRRREESVIGRGG